MFGRRFNNVFVLALISAAANTSFAALTPDNPGPANIQFTINSTANVREISPYIYGMNSFFNSLPSGTYSGPAIALDRLGGNRWTGYNWETNFSNAGSDFNHVNDEYLVQYVNNTPPGQAVLPSLQRANTHDRAVLVTVPTAGYVSADDFGTVSTAEVAPSSRWNQVRAKKSEIYPGSPLSLTSNETDDYAFTDEFVNWIESTKAPGVPTFYTLDNEPDLWSSTHPRLHPAKATFAEMLQKTVNHAKAIKDGAPDALVFGAGNYGWQGFRTLQGATDYTSSPSHPGNADFDFLEWYLNELRLAEDEDEGDRKLLDVLDVHWYPEATGGGTRITFGGVNNVSDLVVAARVQAPRSLWDPTYVESSWITVDSTGGTAVDLLGRLQADIDTFKPDTKLAITEYNYGGGAHISGAIAQADVLGIFGREGVFAATWWNIEGSTASAAPYTYAAFNMFRNYNGTGGDFGDISINAGTSNIAQSAVYASVDPDDPSRMVVVAINRTDNPLTTGIEVTHDLIFDHAEVYQLQQGNPSPQRAADIDIALLNAFQYTMPAMSVTTLVLVSNGIPGDYNNDGIADAADYVMWQKLRNTSTDLPNDPNAVPVDSDQYNTWRTYYGRKASGGSGGGSNVPEPTTALFFVSAAVARFISATRRANRDLCAMDMFTFDPRRSHKVAVPLVHRT